MLKLFMAIIYIIDIVTIFYMIFKEKRSSTSVVSWALILMILPLVGLIIYILVGRQVNQSKMFKVDQVDLETYQRYKAKMVEERFKHSHLKNHKSYEMIRCLENLSYAPFREHNDIELYTDGKEMFDELKRCLSAAEISINIQFYIFKSDEIGSEILRILEDKARKGVEVRLLYDSMGSRGLKKKHLKPLVEAGGKIGEFFPSKLKVINLNMNHRNHRKIVVIDDKIGFVGGFNVGDEYLGKDPKFGYWRDTHIKFTGEAVEDLDLRFLSDWKYATKEDIDLKDAVFRKVQTDTAAGNEGIQILASGPNDNNHFEIKMGYLKMIERAKEYLYIQSPYLIIDDSIKDALKLAALSEVDVRIMIPGKGDHPFVYWANLSYVGELLRAGVKVYHYDKTAFLHAKTVVIDDEVCSIGTANMDTRSFELNFEVNGIIYSEKLAKAQKAAFEADMLKSQELTLEEYMARGTGVKVKEGFSQLFSLVL